MKIKILTRNNKIYNLCLFKITLVLEILLINHKYKFKITIKIIIDKFNNLMFFNNPIYKLYDQILLYK